MIGLKENQSAILEAGSLHFEYFAGELPCFVTRTKDHGRIEKRGYRLLTNLYWLPRRQNREGLQSVGMAASIVTRDGKTSKDTRFFLSSLTNVERFAYAVRKHWAMENQMHWCLDVIFDEDSSKARKDMSLPLNLNVLHKTVLALRKNADFGKHISIQKDASALPSILRHSSLFRLLIF